MRTRLILKPGQNGTKEMVDKYGDRLVCVRYRYDAVQNKRYKTVEIIVDEVDWEPTPRPDELVAIKLAYGELALREKVKAAGGRWNPTRQVWELPYIEVLNLSLENRMARDEDGIYVVKGIDGNFYCPFEDSDDGLGWTIGFDRWEGESGWQEID